MIARQDLESMGSSTTAKPIAAKIACKKKDILASQLAAAS